MSEWDVAFERSEQGGRPVLVVRGEIDLAVASRLAQELDALVPESDSSALVDLSGVSFIDSSGVRELLKAKQSAQSAGGSLTLLSPSSSCQRVLEISGVWSEFSVRDALP